MTCANCPCWPLRIIEPLSKMTWWCRYRQMADEENNERTAGDLFFDMDPDANTTPRASPAIGNASRIRFGKKAQ